tara:strand:+ start:492 stop:1178 length:687 start_codon:yes stop_codon:yes gene_type:complete
MAITLSELKKHVQHALGGSPASQLSEEGIVNEAGRYMFMAPWKFRERPPVTLSFVQNQPFVSLPDDFGEVVSAHMDSGLTKSIHFTTIDDLLERRTTAIGQSHMYYASVVHTDEGQARLEIHPSPSSADKIRIGYRAKWTGLSSDTDKSPTPDYADSALIACVRAFALGYEEEGLEIRLAEIEAGPIYRRLLEKDGIIQPDYGPIRGGAVSQVSSRFNLPFDSTADPS